MDYSLLLGIHDTQVRVHALCAKGSGLWDWDWIPLLVRIHELPFGYLFWLPWVLLSISTLSSKIMRLPEGDILLNAGG